MDTYSTATAPALSAPADIASDPLKRFGTPSLGLAPHEGDRILSDPEMLTAQPFCSRAKMRRPNLDRARKTNLVLALRSELSGWRYPSWQLRPDGKPHPAIPRLFDILGPSSWDVLTFLERHHAALSGSTGIEALAAGRSEDVIAAAEASVRLAS